MSARCITLHPRLFITIFIYNITREGGIKLVYPEKHSFAIQRKRPANKPSAIIHTLQIRDILRHKGRVCEPVHKRHVT